MAAGLDYFNPEVWSGRILKNLNDAHVWANCVNRDYEGEIKSYGDKVHINNIGRVTLLTYTPNSNLTDPETLTSFQRDLDIDQGNAFNFQIDDVDAAQMKPKVMDEAMKEAAYTLAHASDAYLASVLSAATTNVINAVGSDAPTADSAYEYLVDAGVLLDENNVPADGRFVVVPSWYHGLLLKDDRFVTYDKVGSAITNGKIGEAAGFTIYKANTVQTLGGEDATYQVVAGHKMAASFAEQITKVEKFRMEKRFADAVKGLHVFGAKLIRSEAVVVLNAERLGVTS